MEENRIWEKAGKLLKKTARKGVTVGEIFYNKLSFLKEA